MEYQKLEKSALSSKCTYVRTFEYTGAKTRKPRLLRKLLRIFQARFFASVCVVKI